MTNRRPLLSSMDDDYASYAVSQRLAFERTFPQALAAARAFDDEPVLRVLDQGAADGRNSHGLMRDLMALREGRPLQYSFVDMPGNPWTVAAAHLAADPVLAGAAVVPTAADARAVDCGTGPNVANADDHAAVVERALAGGETTVVGMAGIPLHLGLAAPPGTMHIAVSGTTMHWIDAPPSLGSTGSVFPGYPGQGDPGERAEWRQRAAAQWEQLLRLRARELVPGGWLVVALPASETGCPARRSMYVEVVDDMNAVLAGWVAAGRIAQSTADAVVVPVWMRTPGEIRAPFEAGGGAVDGLRLTGLEMFRLDNPYWDDDPQVFARRFVKSCLAWGTPLFRRAFAREGADQVDALLADFVAELEARVAAAPERHRWDYIEALVTCRKDDPPDR